MLSGAPAVGGKTSAPSRNHTGLPGSSRSGNLTTCASLEAALAIAGSNRTNAFSPKYSEPPMATARLTTVRASTRPDSPPSDTSRADTYWLPHGAKTVPPAIAGIPMSGWGDHVRTTPPLRFTATSRRAPTRTAPETRNGDAAVVAGAAKALVADARLPQLLAARAVERNERPVARVHDDVPGDRRPRASSVPRARPGMRAVEADPDEARLRHADGEARGPPGSFTAFSRA